MEDRSKAGLSDQAALRRLGNVEAKLKEYVTLARARAYKADQEPTLHFDGVLDELDINVSLRARPDLHDWLQNYFEACCERRILKHELDQESQEEWRAAIEESYEGWGTMPGY